MEKNRREAFIWMFLESLGDSVACGQGGHIQEIATIDAELVM